MAEEVLENKAEQKEPNKILDFFMKTLNGTAYGLFATLIIGTILGTIGTFFSYGAGNPFCDFMARLFSSSGATPGIAYVFQVLTGAGIGVGVALSLKFDPLKTIVLGVVGEAAAFFSLSTSFVESDAKFTELYNFGALKVGDPLTIYIVCIAVALLIKLVFQKKTPVDIVLIPLFGAIAGLLISMGIRYVTVYITYAIQWLVNSGTKTVPFLMGIIVSVLMGMALTAPISSAAIAAVVFLLPAGADPAAFQGLIIASGAAVIGCSTQMVGFAIQSRKDNPLGMVISIGIGTSMLQFKNIIKKPIIWLPTIIASAILGPISTCWLHIVCTGASAGMGTAGLVGQIGTINSMGVNAWQTWVGIFGLQIIAPALLVFAIDLLFRKLGWIKEGDLKI